MSLIKSEGKPNGRD